MTFALRDRKDYQGLLRGTADSRLCDGRSLGSLRAQGWSVPWSSGGRVSSRGARSFRASLTEGYFLVCSVTLGSVLLRSRECHLDKNWDRGWELGWEQVGDGF